MRPAWGVDAAKMARSQWDCPRREVGQAFAPHDPNLALVERALGVVPEVVYRGAEDWVAILANESQLRQLQPDLGAVAAMGRGLLVSALADDPTIDFVSRCFFPAAGIAEDPVTGSAHTALTPYWAQRLGKRHLIAQQLSQRGGQLWLEDRDQRVSVSGYCCTISRGEWVAADDT